MRILDFMTGGGGEVTLSCRGYAQKSRKWILLQGERPAKSINPSDPDTPMTVGRQLNQLAFYFYIVLSAGKTP